jgi:hypothetical protein
LFLLLFVSSLYKHCCRMSLDRSLASELESLQVLFGVRRMKLHDE